MRGCRNSESQKDQNSKSQKDQNSEIQKDQNSESLHLSDLRMAFRRQKINLKKLSNMS
jgi:hypothetical protein